MKERDQALLSRFGRHCGNSKRPGLRAGANELVQRPLIPKDSEDTGLTQKVTKNTQSSSAALSTNGLCQEIDGQNTGSSPQ